MSDSEFNRLKQDLATIHQALRFEPLFGREEVWVSLLQAAVGLGLAIAGALRVSIAGVPYAGRLIVVFIVILAYLAISLKVRRNKGKYPARWRETRVGLISGAIIAVSLGLFLSWSLHHGLSYRSLASAVTFVGGLATLLIGICDRSRLHYLGTAIPLILVSIAFQTIAFNTHSMDLLVGLFIASNGLLLAGLMAWQLQRQKND